MSLRSPNHQKRSTRMESENAFCVVSFARCVWFLHDTPLETGSYGETGSSVYVRLFIEGRKKGSAQ